MAAVVRPAAGATLWTVVPGQEQDLPVPADLSANRGGPCRQMAPTRHKMGPTNVSGIL
jgi:hypothetical protein